MNFVQQGGDSPINPIAVRPAVLQSPGMQNTGPTQQRYALPSDGFAPQGWAPIGGNATPPFSGGLAPGLPGMGFPSPGGQGGFLGLINNLINQLGALINQYAGETSAEGPGSQTVGDATFSSTGDPHLSETGTLLNASGSTSPVNQHVDSMTSHDNLLSSQDFDGGYRLSTTVTAANDKGVTLNASATVHANSGQDTITMRNDGSFSITSNGNSVSLDAGQSVTLMGGEQVTRNTDGSLTLLDQNAFGGSITTTMTAKGGGVDVTAAVHNATVGGDIASAAVHSPAPPNTSSGGSFPAIRNANANAITYA